MIIPFATQSYQSDSLPLSAQRLINLYAEKEPEEAKSHVSVFGSPGLTQFATLDGGPVRGMHVMNGVLYAVSGATLYSVSATGVATPLGSAVGGSGLVSMADNGTQLCMVNGVNGYIWSALSGFTVISDLNFNAANTVTFFDNVFVFDWLGTNKVFISNSLDGTTYNGLGFSTAEVTSALVLSTLNQTETLLIFTGDHIETWYDAGAPIFPFLRVDGATIERGCAAAKSPVKEDNAVFFLGDDLVFYRLQGVQPMRVSTHAIEAAWRGYTTVSDCFTFSYTFEGHKFIAVTFPTANVSWHLDISTTQWHERESWDANNNSFGRWRANCHANCYGMELIGDALSGKIGSVDKTVYTEFGNTMRGQAVSPPIHNDRKRMTVSRLELDFEAGVGVAGPASSGNDGSTVLLLHCDGAPGASVFIDSSPKANIATAVGVVSTSQAQMKFGTASASFDGTPGSFVSLPNAAYFNPTGDFSIDMWVYLTTIGLTSNFIAKDGTFASYGMQMSAAGNAVFFASSAGVSFDICNTVFGPAGAVTANAWHHLAVSRAGNNYYGFVDGAGGAFLTSSVPFLVSSAPLLVGSRTGAANGVHGFLDEVRFSNTAIYTAPFTPPTAPYSALPPPGVNPQVMLDWSKDGGHTYGAMQVWQALGKIGAYLTRLRWLRLGQARQWVFRYSITDPVRRTLIAANADVSSGM